MISGMIMLKSFLVPYDISFYILYVLISDSPRMQHADQSIVQFSKYALKLMLSKPRNLRPSTICLIECGTGTQTQKKPKKYCFRPPQLNHALQGYNCQSWYHVYNDSGGGNRGYPDCAESSRGHGHPPDCFRLYSGM